MKKSFTSKSKLFWLDFKSELFYRYFAISNLIWFLFNFKNSKKKNLTNLCEHCCVAAIYKRQLKVSGKLKINAVLGKFWYKQKLFMSSLIALNSMKHSNIGFLFVYVLAVNNCATVEIFYFNKRIPEKHLFENISQSWVHRILNISPIVYWIKVLQETTIRKSV